MASSAATILADATRAANIIAKLPLWTELDPEAVLTAFREKALPQGPELTLAGLQALFYGALTPLRAHAPSAPRPHRACLATHPYSALL